MPNEGKMQINLGKMQMGICLADLEQMGSPVADLCKHVTTQNLPSHQSWLS